MKRFLKAAVLLLLLTLSQNVVTAEDNVSLETRGGVSSLVLPGGEHFWALGVNHIGNTDAPTASDQPVDRVGLARSSAAEMLRSMGYNSAGGDCQGVVQNQLPYFVTIGLTNTAHWMAGHQFQFEDVFEEDYAKRIEAVTKRTCNQHRENPNLIGYYWTDTPRWDLELTRVRRGSDWVSFIRSLPAESAGRTAYVTFLRRQFNNDINEFNQDFRMDLDSFDDVAATDLSGVERLRPQVQSSDEAFLGVIANRIYGVAAAALDRHDPTALKFGEKYKGHDHPNSVLRAASQVVDVISIQPGPEFGPFPGQGRHEQRFDTRYFNRVNQLTGKPIMIADHAISWKSADRPATLWYQYPNQAAAVRSYHNYLVAAASSPFIIGYCRCQYISEYRADRRLLKQGLLDENGDAYQEIVGGFSKANRTALNVRDSMTSALFTEAKPGDVRSPVDLLVNSAGNRITKIDQWPAQRERLLGKATRYIYGSMPEKPTDVSFQTLLHREVMNGAATETLFVMNIHRDGKTVPVRVGLLRPISTSPCPVIIKNDRWLFDLSAMPPGRKLDQYAAQKREQTFREVSEVAIKRGYAICKFVREDLAADSAGSRQTGVLGMYPEFDWGAIAAWAWGYQPLIDHLLDNYNIDGQRIVATGHSRGGKTALAAAIFDNRISIAAPSASGSGGTGSMQHFTADGAQQTPELLSKNHNFWFSSALGQLDASKQLPVDGHTLRALVAPRGIINTQGKDDRLANPRGTRMMFDVSEPVFALLGEANRTAVHWRSGGHGHTTEDWQAILDYADAYFAGDPLPKRFNIWPSKQ